MGTKAFSKVMLVDSTGNPVTGQQAIIGIEFYNDVAATGLTSVSAATDDTTPTTVLGSVALAALTGGKNLTPYAGPLVIGTGKHLKYTIVGNGTAGSIQATVRFYPAVSGAGIS